MAAHDNWPLPSPAGTEDGFTFYDLGDGVRLFDMREHWIDAFGDSGPVEKIGYAVHHAVTGVGDGTLQGDITIIDAIHRYHTAPPPNGNGWPGIGYGRIIGSGRRVYLLAGSASQRAHVAGLNHQWIGYCFLGTWTHQRPDEDRMAAFRRATQWETDQRGVPMLLAPHKRLNAGTTECPGGWAGMDAWEGLVLTPSALTPPPAPPTIDIEGARADLRAALVKLGG